MQQSGAAAPRPPRGGRSAVPVRAWTILVFAVLAVALLLADRAYRDHLTEHKRDEVRSALTGHAFALSTAVARRLGVLNAFGGWVRAERDWREEFDAVAPALHAAAAGVRALQVVEEGRIVRTWPLEGNEVALGLDLLAHPDPRVRDGLLRAYRTGGPTVTGPVSLVQGGTGIILREAPWGDGDPSRPSVAVVLDLQPVLAEAGLLDATDEGLHVALGAPGVQSFWGDPTGPRAERVTVALPEGTWELRGEPAGGFEAAVVGDRRLFQTVGILILVLATAVAHLVLGRQSELEEAVAVRTEELERAARRLEDQEESLQAALRAGRVFAWSWHVRDGSVERSRGFADLLGDDGSLAGSLSAMRQRVHPADDAALQEALDEVDRTGRFSAEYRLRRSDGRDVWVRDEGRVVERDEEGRVVRVVGATADISHIKELESKVLHAQKMEEVGRLAATVAHDFNNLLTVMQVNAELVVESAPRVDLEDVHQIERAIEHAKFLVGRLLAFSRRDVVQPEDFDMDDALRDSVGMIQPILGTLTRVETELGAAGARVHMDRGQLTQVLFNLAVNARDAMPEGGVFRVRSESRNGTGGDGAGVVVLTVEDEGPGIPESVMPVIFEPFVTTKATEKGTGLGLSTVRTIVESAGGTVEAGNRPEGGARFVVTLPAA